MEGILQITRAFQYGRTASGIVRHTDESDKNEREISASAFQRH